MSITDTRPAGADPAEAAEEGAEIAEEVTEAIEVTEVAAVAAVAAVAEEVSNDEGGAEGAALGHTAEVTPGDSGAAQPEQFVMPGDAVTHPMYPIGHRGEVDPADLVVGPNRRKAVVLGAVFVNSIKARGVLRRIDVYQDAAGHLLIEDGQRRTLGALRAGRASVPFEVVEEPADAAGLIYHQLAVNDHERMTTHDVAASYRQLSLLGETPTKMARESGRKAKEVKGLLTVAESAAARAAGEGLTFEQYLVIAEFDGDADAQRRLTDGLRWGNFTHVAQQLRDARADREAKQKILDDAAAQGIPVVDGAGYDHTAQPLTRLGLDGEDAAEEHRSNCAGHAVVVTTEWSGTGRIWVAKPVCQDPVANGHTVPDWVKREMQGSAPTAKKKIADMDPQEAEQARAERKEIRDNNLAWQSAVVVRRDWLATQFVKRTAVPSGAELFVAGELLRNPHYLRDGLSDGLPPLAEAVLATGATRALTHSELAEHLIGKITTSKRALVLATAVIFYAWENSHGGDDHAKGTWRRFTADDTRVLRQMQTWGYPLADVERLVAYPKPTKKTRGPRRPAAHEAVDAATVNVESVDVETADPARADATAQADQATTAEHAADVDPDVPAVSATVMEPKTAGDEQDGPAPTQPTSETSAGLGTGETTDEIGNVADTGTSSG